MSTRVPRRPQEGRPGPHLDLGPRPPGREKMKCGGGCVCGASYHRSGPLLPGVRARGGVRGTQSRMHAPHAPVFPDVGSMSVSPGRSTPARSASSTIRRLMRSLTLPPALKNSHLATGSETGHEKRAQAPHACRSPLPTRPHRDRPGPHPQRTAWHLRDGAGTRQGAAHWPQARTPSAGQLSDCWAEPRGPHQGTRCPEATALGHSPGLGPVHSPDLLTTCSVCPMGRSSEGVP